MVKSDLPDRLRFPYHRSERSCYFWPFGVNLQGRDMKGSDLFSCRTRASVETRDVGTRATKQWDERTQRNPMLLFLLSGLFLFRLDARRLSGLLLFQDPPRRTRADDPLHTPSSNPFGSKTALINFVAIRQATFLSHPAYPPDVHIG